MSYSLLIFTKPGDEVCEQTKANLISVASYFNTSYQEIDASDYKNSSLCAKHFVSEAPMTVLLCDGKESLSQQGFKSVESFIQILQPYLK